MARSYFNWKLLIVLVLAIGVLGATAFGLRKWQKSRRAGQGLVLGSKAYDEHNWEEAARQLGRYLTIAQDDVPTLLKYAEANLNIRPLKQGNVQQAIAAYRNVLRLEAGNVGAASRLSGLYLNMGMPGEAELIASRALQNSESPELRKILAVALASQRKFAEAEKELKDIIRKDPGQALAYEVMGRLVEQRPEEFTESSDFWFNEAVKANPSSADVYIARGAYFLRQGKTTEAMADLEIAEQKDLNDLTTRLRLAEEFLNAGALDGVRKQLEIVQHSEPNNPSLWQQWTRLALQSDSNELMFKVADTGLKELSSQPWDFMPGAAELFIKCGRYEQAEECLSKLRQKEVSPATTAYLEGLLAENQGRTRDAVKCWRRAVGLGAKSAKVRIALANAVWRLGDVQSAINQLRTLISEQPNLYSGRMALAQILINTGRWAEAVEQTRQARQLAPRSIDAVLLDVRARLQMLADNQTSRDSPLYRDIEATLDNLDKVSDGAVEVKLLQVRLAVLKNNLPRAEELLADLKKANPSESRVVLAQADLFVAQNKVDDAIALLREKVVALPRSTAVLKYLVALLAAKNERQECETLVKNAIASETTEYTKKEMELLLCDIYGRWSEDAKRCALLNSLAEQLKDDISVLRELLTCEDIYKGAGRAQQVIDKIKSIEGDDGWQWRYEQAKVWFAQEDFKNRYPQIVSLLQENLRANPDDQPSRMLLAASYEKGGDMRLAVSTYTEALNRSPRDVRIIVPAVAALYRSGEYDRADEILKQAAKEKLRHPDLERLEVQGAIRRGDLDSANNTMEKVLARDPNNLSTVLSLALLKIRQNDLADAQKLVTALRTREPNSLSVAAIQVDLDIRSGRSEEALRLCDEMVRKLNSVSSLLLRGRAYAVIGKLDSAGEDFQRAVTMEPNNADAWVAKGLFHQTHGQADKAIADVRQAMSALPDNLQIQKAAITIYMASENSDLRKEGESILEKALVTNPDDIELRLRKAQTLLAKGTAPGIEQATAILQSITESRPQVADAWALLARAALQEGKSAKAIDACLRGLVHSPNDKTLLLLKAEAEAASSPELALPTMKALWELDTNNIETAVSLAELYIAAGQYDNAINLLGKQPVSANASQQRKINLALAVALHKNGSKSESDEIIKGLSESGPNDVRLLLTRLRLLRDDKSWPRLKEIVDDWCEKNFSQTQTAVYIFDELSRSKEVEGRQMAEEFSRCVLKNDENSAVLMMRLGTLLQASGRTSEAAVLYKRVLDKQADDLIAINNLAWILCEDQKNPQEALELAQRGLKKAPEYVDLLDTRGMAFYRLGRFGDAAEDFKKCVSLYPAGAPGRVSSHFHLGRSLADLGEKNQAIEQLNRAIELNKEVGALDGSDLAEAHKLLEKLTGGK